MTSDEYCWTTGLRIRHTDDEFDALVLDLAADGPITNSSLRQRTGLDRQEALRVLRRLVDRDELRQVGERRGARDERP